MAHIFNTLFFIFLQFFIMNTTLKFNEQYNNYSGLSPVTATITSTPEDITARLGASVSTMGFNVKLDESFNVTFVEGDEEVTATVDAGEFAVTARGNQYNSEMHVIGAKILLNINYKDGSFLFTASGLTQTALRPTIKLSRKKVEAEVDAFVA